ncbi:FGGY family carbohydrate kinase [Oceanispirochaeta sp.]|uniref:xylulokinase n=1 Tax=Oceanispirochaeta sp. TaxID=2035350 RepID=UPI0026370FB6|nr:FGGY family carbohydrate kinase [Oceanispirochaeta sp.]MDA3956068.1 FGGY family carbohydrate kinase [Oceanispirochaeta sp.]
MPKYILSIDLGTTSTKTVLFDDKLKVVASAKAEYPTVYPRQGWAEQNPEDWWEALVSTTAEILKKSGVDPVDIVGIGADSMSSMALPLDKDGLPLRNGLIWLDRRSQSESDWIRASYGDLQKKINSNDSDPSNFAPKVLWMKNNERDLYNKTSVFLHCNGYLVYRLTGIMSMDLSEAGMSQLCDIRTGQWSDELITASGIDRSKLPEIFACTDVVGGLNTAAATVIGLKEGTPVIAGAMDNVSATLGLGLRHDGQAYISAGTATNAGACVASVPSDPTMLNYHHAVPGLYLVNGGVDYGGAGLRWFKSLIEEEDFAEIDRLAEEAGYLEDVLLYLPYMVGQRAPLWDPHSRAAAFGMNPDTSRKAMIRMIMEGIAMGVRNVFRLMEEKGYTIDEIVMTGGCANSPIWTQIFSDILEKTIILPGEMDVAPLGTAIMIAVGVGLYPDFDSALAIQTVRGSHTPDTERSGYYNALFKAFVNLYKAVGPVYKELDEIREKFQS